MKYEIRRMATLEEIRIYKIVNTYMNNLSDDNYFCISNMIGEYVFAYKKEERRRAYQALYRTARKIGVYVEDLATWYSMDVIE